MVANPVLHEPSGEQPGDTFHVTIGAGAKYVAVGKNISQVFYLPPEQRPPLWVGVPTLSNRENIVGRQALLDDLVWRLHSGQSPALSADGLPGVGKTTLAILIAYDERIRDHFSDGVLWAGLGPNSDVASVQGTWAEALGVDLREVADVRKRQERISQALGDRKVLVVIDDAWQIEAAQALQCSAPGVAHVLTTRNSSLARQFAKAGQSVKVPVLDDNTAWELFQRLAPEMCAAEPEPARKLADAVGGLPLAVELLGGYLAAPEHAVFDELSQAALIELSNPVRRLALAQTRLGNVSGQVETLEAVIRLSVEDLAKLDASAVNAFYALGAFAPKPAAFDRSAAEAVAGTPAAILAILVARNLLEVGAKGALAMHQVIHDTAVLKVPGAAIKRHCSYYLDLVKADCEDWEHIEAAMGQIRQAWSALANDDKRLLEWFEAMQLFFERRGLWEEHIAWAKRALIYSQDCQDGTTSAPLLNNIGTVYASLGNPKQALAYLNQALRLCRQSGDRIGEAATLNNFGGIYSALGEKQRALEHSNQALSIYRKVDNKDGEAATLNNIGLIYYALGERQQALKYYTQALPIYRKSGNRSGEATSLNNIGLVYDVLGEKQKALEYYNQALPLVHQVGSINAEAATLNNIGEVYADLGDKQRALAYYNQVLPLVRQVADKRGEGAALNNIGMVYSELGEIQRALEYLNQALPIRRQVGDKGGEATTLNNIGVVYCMLGEEQKALKYYEEVLPLLRQVGDKGGEASTLNNVGLIYDNAGEKHKALEYYNQALSLRCQVGDRWGEVVTRYNLAMVAVALGDLIRAENEIKHVVAIEEATGHPDLESDRRTLAQIRALRDKASNR